MLHWLQDLTKARDEAYAKLADRFLWALLAHVTISVVVQMYTLQHGGGMYILEAAHNFIVAQCKSDPIPEGFSNWLLGVVADTISGETPWYNCFFSSLEGTMTLANETLAKLATMLIPSYSAVMDLTKSILRNVDTFLALAPCYAMHVTSGILTIASTALFYWLSKIVPHNVRIPLIAACAMWTHGMSGTFVGPLALIFASLVTRVHRTSMEIAKQHMDSAPTAHDLMEAFVAFDDRVSLGGWFVWATAAGSIIYQGWLP